MPSPEVVETLLEQLNAMVYGDESRIKFRYVDFRKVREQDINANVMPQGMFNALVQNISNNKALESLPLCCTREETPNLVEVVSGHHRIRAAIQAGIFFGIVLCYERLTPSEIGAKQLAHNAIHGESDPEIVKEIFNRIEGIEFQMETYIDPKMFDSLPEPVAFEQIDLDPLADAKVVTVVFLPTQHKDWAKAMELLTDKPDEVYLASRDSFDAFKSAVQQVRSELDVFSYPTAIAQMARLAVECLQKRVDEQAVIADAVSESDVREAAEVI